MKSVFHASALLLAVILATSTMSTALGRAGGGGGYSGGSSSSYSSSSSSSSSSSYGGSYSSYSSSGSGSGEAPSLLTFLFMIPVALIALAVSALQSGGQQPPGGSSSSSQLSRPRRVPVNRRAARAQVRAAEPTFDVERFLNRFEAAFTQIQDAWQEQDMQPVRHFVSDGVFERFSLQIEEQQQFAYRDQMTDLTIESRDLAEFTQDDGFDVLTVMVTASVIDYRVSLENGSYISGNRDPETFTEMWTFVRRRGSTRRSAAGLIEGNCPNCGSSISLNQADQCTSCKSHIRSGEYDWILTEITQACEWRPRSTKEKSWAERYRAEHDAGFSSQHLEDRASVIFWRDAMAARLGDTHPLLKVATNAFCDQMSLDLSKSQHGLRQFQGDRSVGSVDTLGIVTDSDADYALVEVRWSASVHKADPSGRVQDCGQWRRRQSLFVLMRRAGVPSQLSRAITSAHCPNCGAVESVLTAHSCEFCNTVLNDGRLDWVLHEVHPLPHSAGATAWKNRLHTQRSQQIAEDLEQSFAPWYANSDVLAWAACVLAPKLHGTSEERKLLLTIGRKAGVPDANVESLIQTVQGKSTEELIAETRTDDFAAMIPQNHTEAGDLLQQLTEIILIDGTISDHEQETLFHIGRLMDFAPHDIRMMINKQKACMASQHDMSSAARPVGHSGYQRALLNALICVAAADRKITAAERREVIQAMTRIGRRLSRTELRDTLTLFVEKRKQLGWDEFLEFCCQDLARQCRGNGRKRIARRAMAAVARADTDVDSSSERVITKLTSAINSAA